MPTKQQKLLNLLKQLNDVSWHYFPEDLSLEKRDKEIVSSLNDYVNNYCPKFLLLEDWTIVATYYSVFINTLPLKTPFKFYEGKMAALLNCFHIKSYEEPYENSTKGYLKFKILHMGFREFIKIQQQTRNIKARKSTEDIESLLRLCSEMQNLFSLHKKFLEQKEEEYRDDIIKIEILISHVLSVLREALDLLQPHDQVTLLIEKSKVVLDHLDSIVSYSPKSPIIQFSIQHLRFYSIKLSRWVPKINQEDLFFKNLINLLKGVLSFGACRELREDFQYLLPFYSGIINHLSDQSSYYHEALRLQKMIFLFFDAEVEFDLRNGINRVIIHRLLEKETYVLRKLLLPYALAVYASGDKNSDHNLMSFDIIGRLTEWSLENNIYFIQNKYHPLFLKENDVSSASILKIIRNRLPGSSSKDLFEFSENINFFKKKRLCEYQKSKEGVFIEDEFDYYILLFFIREVKESDVIRMKDIIKAAEKKNFPFSAGLMKYLLGIFTQCLEIDKISFSHRNLSSFNFHSIHSNIIGCKIKLFDNPVFLNNEAISKNEILLSDLRALCYGVLEKSSQDNLLLALRFLLKKNNFLEFTREERGRILETAYLRIDFTYKKNKNDNLSIRLRKMNMRKLLSRRSADNLKKLFDHEIKLLELAIEIRSLIVNLPGDCKKGIKTISPDHSNNDSVYSSLIRWREKLEKRKKFLEKYPTIYRDHIVRLKKYLNQVVDKSNMLGNISAVLSDFDCSLRTHYDFFLEYHGGSISSRMLVRRILQNSPTGIVGVSAYDFLVKTDSLKRTGFNLFWIKQQEERLTSIESFLSEYTDIYSDNEEKNDEDRCLKLSSCKI